MKMDLSTDLRRALPRLLAASAAIVISTAALPQARISPDEIDRVLSFGPWPPATIVDPGNRVSGQPAAIELGRHLFFDARLSRVGYIGCVTCHQPDRAWGDGKARAHGLADVDRNTPMLTDLSLKRWFGWAGASDSLWMASLRPILDERELDSTPAHVRHVYARDPDLACWYRRAFGRAADDPDDDDITVLVNTGKALAAFQETLVSERAPFDEYRDAMARGDSAKAAHYPSAAERGLRIFIGPGNCARCHNGPNFSDGEFHLTGVGRSAATAHADTGRFDGIVLVANDRFNLLSQFNDDPTRANALATRNVLLAPRKRGEFRTPSLRNVAVTAPYMHNGSFETLRDVLERHPVPDEDSLNGADGGRSASALKLNAAEIGDLTAFLESLTDRFGADRPRPDTPKECITTTQQALSLSDTAQRRLQSATATRFR